MLQVVESPASPAVFQTPIPANSAKAQPKLIARWINSIDELEQLKCKWENLANNCLWRNLSFEHNYLIPALRHLNDAKARVLIIETDSTNDQQQIYGLVPLFVQNFRRLPIKCINTWKHDQCFDTTPLIRDDRADDTMDCMFDFLSNDGFGLFNFDTVSAEPSISSLFERALQKKSRCRFTRETWNRAAIQPGDDPEKYISQYVSKSVRKTLGRLGRRLSEQGIVSVELSDENSDFQSLTDHFLRLESLGWKGEAGTALACHPNTRSFFEELIERSRMLDRASFLSLKLDDVPIAIVLDIISGGQVCSYKTAFDTKYSDYSPGQQIELHHVRLLHTQNVEFVDSCTDPDNEKINRMWGQRIAFESFVVALKPGIAKMAVNWMPTLKRIVSKAKTLLAGIQK